MNLRQIFQKIRLGFPEYIRYFKAGLPRRFTYFLRKKYYSWDKPIVVCAMCKNEEPYIKEFIDYHLSIGFDKICLYDNNDPQSPLLSDFLKEYIDNRKVMIIDVRGKSKYLLNAYNHFATHFYKDFSWAAIIDIDEFITLNPPYSTIRDYIKEVNDKGFVAARLSWQMYGDCGHLYASPEPVQERFTIPCDNKGQREHVKSIAKVTNILVFPNAHIPCMVGKWCNGDIVHTGEISSAILKPVYGKAYVKHYFTKSLEEFLISKTLRGDAANNFNYSFLKWRLDMYYSLNERTEEKDRLTEQLVSQYYPEFFEQFKKIKGYSFSTVLYDNPLK